MDGTLDTVVIGSGPVGSTYARVIKEAVPQARVLLVESGPIVSDPPGRHVRTIVDPDERVAAQIASQGPNSNPADYEAQAARALSPGRGRTSELLARPGTWLLHGPGADRHDLGMPAAAMSSNVGGMGAHWSGACPVPDLGERCADLDPGELELALHEAAARLKVTRRAFDFAPLGAAVRARLAEAYDPGRSAERRVQPMPLAIELSEDGARRWTGPAAILGDLLDAAPSSFELRPETTAKRLLADGRRVTGVLLEDRSDGREYTVRARTVVVAADSLRTPQLLHASAIHPRSLGRHLNEHTIVTSTVQLDPGFAWAADRAASTRAGAIDALAGVSWIPFVAGLFPFHGQITQWDASPIPVDRDLEVWPGSVVECSFFMGKEDLRFEDRVEFDDEELDHFGMPAIRIHHRLTERDRAKRDALVAEARRAGGLLGTPVGGEDPVIFPPGASLHYEGTIRIGQDDQTSVIDPDMRVWGYDNLYLGGNGTIPTSTAGNPTLTSVAHAVIGAHRLVAALG